MTDLDWGAPATLWQQDEGTPEQGGHRTRLDDASFGRCVALVMQRAPADRRALVISTAGQHLLRVTDIELLAKRADWATWQDQG